MVINWEMIGVLVGLLSIQGTIFLAAAKSVFITKKEFSDFCQAIERKLSNKHGMPILVSQASCDKTNQDRDRRKDQALRVMCDKIIELKQEFQAWQMLMVEKNKGK